MIDLDPQRSATQWARQGAEKFHYPVIPTEITNPGQFKAELDHIGREHNADIILFDTPPSLENEAMIAALLSDLVLIPVTPSPLDIWAAEKAVKMVREAQKERGGKPTIALVPSRLMPNTVLAREIHISLKAFGESIAPSISMRVAMAEAPIAGQTINTYAPGSPSHNEFKELLKFVFTNIPK